MTPCKDRDVIPFTAASKLDSAEARFDVKTCRKGYTMMIVGAENLGVKEANRGLLRQGLKGC
jgi:hypothetical protein